ncbi:hypothetical protein GCM10010961_31080 [Pseudodonghicola xiamenensis]|uniref:Uncharacterized protein n=1 Tax=Pseudodonghicola xiamenensis TaxID=337702 RepID=A0A8J3HAG9_9RHOB|nr:hypothetical protein GCM10010961_31080 [Pseudodonghicola xiamenensis]
MGPQPGGLSNGVPLLRAGASGGRIWDEEKAKTARSASAQRHPERHRGEERAQRAIEPPGLMRVAEADRQPIADQAPDREGQRVSG